jgi:plastocyanin
MSGVAPAPSQLNFSIVGVGQSSSAQAVIITNGSSYAIPYLTLAAGPPFALSLNNCTGSLAAGANCNAAVTFQPNSSGAATGALTVTSSALPAPASVALSGIGFDFAAAVSGPSTFTVASGQTANYTLTINPANGAAGVFTYTCGALPANAQCVFNPATTTISAGSTGNMAVAISTGKAGTARLESPAPWRVIPMTCGLLLLPLLFVRRRKSLLLLVLLAVMAGVASSCSSSGGSRRRHGFRYRWIRGRHGHQAGDLFHSGYDYVHRRDARGYRQPDRGLTPPARVGEKTTTGYTQTSGKARTPGLLNGICR